MKVGVHISKVSSILKNPYKNRKSLLDAIRIECDQLKINTCQIFVQGPKNGKMSNIDEINIKKYCTEGKINLYVHSSYITVGCWNINNQNKFDKKSQYFINLIEKQLDVCDAINSNGFVIHLSKKTPEQIIETLKILFPFIKKYKTPILLEQPAKKPDINMTYESPEKINYMTELIIKELPNLYFGWCLDTCHLWSGGIELNKSNIIKKYFLDFKYPKYIKLFHLNGGNIKIFNTGVDKHDVILSKDDNIFSNSVHKIGDINKSKKTNLGILIKFAKKNNIDTILEVNTGNFTDVDHAIDTIKTLI